MVDTRFPDADVLVGAPDTLTRRGADRVKLARLRTATEERTGVRLARISVARVRVHNANTNRDLGDLRALAASLDNTGLDQPITVQQHDGWFEVTDGARRFVAARLAGRRAVLAFIRPPRPDDEVLAASIATDVHKKRMTPAERGRVVQMLKDAGWSVPDIASYLGVADSTVYGWLAQAASEPQPPAGPAELAAITAPPAVVPQDPAASGRARIRAAGRRGAPKWKARVAELRRRWESRIGEHGLTAEQAAALLAELAELDGAGQTNS